MTGYVEPLISPENTVGTLCRVNSPADVLAIFRGFNNMKLQTSAFEDSSPRRRISALSSRFAPPDRTCSDRILQRDQHLFVAGDVVNVAYLVVAGVLKSYVLHENGDEQVLEFHLPGDVIGLDALVETTSSSSVMALDTSNVRALSIHHTRQRSHQQSGQDGLADADVIITGMYREILRLTRRLHMASSSTNARLANFLLDYSQSQACRGCDPDVLLLPMKRRDLARYLGLATETLSRSFSRLRDKGLLSVDNNDIAILDRAGLREAAGLPAEESSASRNRG